MTEKEIYKTIAEEEQYCMLCGSTRNLNIHHIRYGACGRHTYLGNIIRLCFECHQRVHKDKKRWQPFLIKIADEHEKQMGRTTQE